MRRRTEGPRQSGWLTSLRELAHEHVERWRAARRRSSVSARVSARRPGGSRRRGPWAGLGAHSLDGACNTCGGATRFHYSDLATCRESLVCEHCGTTSRYRSIAKGILRALEELRGVRAGALAELPSRLDVAQVRVLETQVPYYARTSAYPIPDLLRRCDWIRTCCTIHRPELPMGADLGQGVANQDLERLTFESGSFDLVITSDVLEHVRLDRSAHAEIARVLKPGGVYVFTVPHGRSLLQTMQRVTVHDPRDPTKDEQTMEPEYHEDVNAPREGALSYRVYGLDLDDQLAAEGLRVEYERRDDRRGGIVDTELFYCRKSPATGALPST